MTWDTHTQTVGPLPYGADVRGSSTLPGGGGELRGLGGQSVERASRVSGDDGGGDALRPAVFFKSHIHHTCREC